MVAAAVAVVKSRRPCRTCGDVEGVAVHEEEGEDSFSSCSSKDEGPLLSKHHAVLEEVDSDESLLFLSHAGKKMGRHSPSPHRLSPTFFPALSSPTSSASPSAVSSASFLSSFIFTRLLHRKTLMVGGVVATLSLSCAVWNNACYMYMDLLDVEPPCRRMRDAQLKILKSWMCFVIFHCWRVCMPLAYILQCAIAVFLDKTLWFAAFSTRVYLWFVVALSIVTVAHLSEIGDVLKDDAHLCL